MERKPTWLAGLGSVRAALHGGAQRHLVGILVGSSIRRVVRACQFPSILGSMATSS